ncbi:MAG: hypothetical protein IJS79_04760 [Oscillospiraceae bacterium]|nr:hypothetical protein [Oscillospiraceae bacterium]
MSEREKKRIDFYVLIRALIAWAVCAFALLACASVLYAAEGTNLSTMGYASSIISFLAAAAFGAAAGRGKGKGAFAIGLGAGILLTGALLLIGFMAGGRLNGSAVLSTSSFTVAGSLLGAVLFAKGRRKRRVTRRKA